MFQASCSLFHRLSATGQGRPGPRGVEFIGVYEDRAELVPSLRSARTIVDMQRILLEARRPGHGLIRARFRVSLVLSDGGHRVREGDLIALIFRSPKDPGDRHALPKKFIGRAFRVVLYDEFDRRRYYGRFSCHEWREGQVPLPIERATLLGKVHAPRR